MLTSKVAIIGPSTRRDCDVDYLFGQVHILKPMIDYGLNCGNISSAVGPFAIDEGLVDAVEPVTIVRIHQVNTRTVIVAEVPVRGKKAEVEGDYAIDGVPGTGARINLDFSGSAGGITGSFLPTGNVVDALRVDGEGDFEVSMVDAANPTVFIRASDVGLEGTETPQQIDSAPALIARVEKIRGHAAVAMGLVDEWDRAVDECPNVPFAALCAPATSYASWTTGQRVDSESIDICVRLMAMERVHQAYPVSGTICTVAASMIPGTIVNQIAKPEIVDRGELRVGHPAGIIAAEGRVDKEGESYVLKRAAVGRTARCLMKGYAFIPKSTIS
jgi:2-methylaconitate cis-trans-isomerase PrpF